MEGEELPPAEENQREGELSKSGGGEAREHGGGSLREPGKHEVGWGKIVSTMGT